MGKISKKSAFYTVLVILLLAYAYFAKRYTKKVDVGIITDIFLMISRNLIHNGLMIVWLVTVRQRIMQKSVRKYLLAMVGLLLFWSYMRTVKWMFLASFTTACRFFWYTYYIPIILIPLLGVFVVQYIGRPEEYELPKWMKLFYIPAITFIGLVFTNDIHRLVFDFPEGIKYSSDCYTYQGGYFVIIAWVICLGVYFVLGLLLKCRVPGRRRFQKLPILIICCAAVICSLYCLRIWQYDLTAMCSLIIILLLESCIQSGLIRSNSKYGILFHASSIEAQIVNQDYEVCYSSDNADFLDKEVMRDTSHGSVNLGNKRLNGAEISHGHVLWCDDISEINTYIQALEETGKRIAGSNALLKKRLNLKEKNLKIIEKNRLYDSIVNEVSGQLDTLDRMLEEDAAAGIRDKLPRICAISVYVKRRTNLLLMAENSCNIPAGEMEFCLRESLDNIRLTGALCSLDSECRGEVPARDLAAAYDVFENMIEQSFGALDALLAKVRISNEKIFMRLQMDCSARLTLPEDSTWVSLGGSLKMKKEDDTLWVELYLDRGGI